MMRLSGLSREELAWLQTLQPCGELHALGERVRQHVVAALGVKVAVSCLPNGVAGRMNDHDEPLIEISPELMDAWVNARYGGGKTQARNAAVHDATFVSPLVALVRRALAQTAINLGEKASWPCTLRLQAVIGKQGGMATISLNSERIHLWARRAIREKS